jgi:molecular chaperone DnaJ
MSKDYYKILGVERGASPDDIKKAFRKLAHQYHPDKPGGNEAKFKEANEAYQVLNDPVRRQKYDQFGSAAFKGSGGFGGFSPGGGFSGDFSAFGGFEDLGDLFGNMFGGGGPRSRSPRGGDIQVDVDLTFREAVFGAPKEITLTKPSTCERCGGVGAEPGTRLKTCMECGGSGSRVTVQRTMLGTMQRRQTCSSCQGSGEAPEKRCAACTGTGILRVKKTLVVEVPGGVEDGNMIRLRGEGEAIRGGSPGDLFVRLHVADDPHFTREGSAIFSDLKIGFTQAALGDTVEVRTIDGSVELRIPAGTQSRTEFRLRGKGVSTQGKRGDHLVTVHVVSPRSLTKKQKELLVELNLREK